MQHLMAATPHLCSDLYDCYRLQRYTHCTVRKLFIGS